MRVGFPMTLTPGHVDGESATGLKTRRLLTSLIRVLGLDELPGGGKGM